MTTSITEQPNPNFVSTCKACKDGSYYKYQCNTMTINVPKLSCPLTVETWSWTPSLREAVTINAGDELKICGMCTWERMCYHDIVINDTKSKTFSSEEIVMMLYKLKIPDSDIPEHFRSSYDHYVKRTTK